MKLMTNFQLRPSTCTHADSEPDQGLGSQVRAKPATVWGSNCEPALAMRCAGSWSS
jgi:hypothetical protein